MKKILLFISFVIIFGSCGDDIFDRQPLDKISEAIAWENEAMIRAIVTDLYTRLPSTSVPSSLSSTILNYCDESTTGGGNSNSITTGGASRTNDNLPYWDYTLIRDLNIFLQKIADAPIIEISKKQMEGEVRTMRAMVYFEMQKRYGGVPLVDVPLEPFLEVDEKYTKRSTEEAIADFIDSELTLAISLLTENTSPKGQINKWTAYAFKARFNLWAASIAKYGSVQLGGLVGIPAARANEFYGKASAAAEAVIASGKYSLYDKISDRSENYRKLFIDDNNNPEVIFERLYDGVNLGHSWDYHYAPNTFVAHGSVLNPLLEFVLGFENIGGSADQPEFGPENLYDNGYSPFVNKDPRLHGTVFFQGDAWGGRTIETYEGLDPNPIPNPDGILIDGLAYYEGVPVVGANSRNITEKHKATATGFLIKKYLDEETYIIVGNSKTNWKILRLAEMYLTKAEAEFEIGNLVSAANALNATRARASISLVDESTITLNHIRTERKSEMSNETNRYWDLRRWRIAEEVLNGAEFKGLRIILHYETGKYYFLPLDLAEGFSRTFRPEHYYNPITDSRINNNPDLVENPLY